MQQVALSLFILLAGLPALEANDPEDKNSPFYYDWHSLQVGGLVCAGILCAVGIFFLISEWEMQMQVQPEGQPLTRGHPTSCHPRLCPQLLRRDPRRSTGGLSLSLCPHSAQETHSRMESSLLFSESLARSHLTSRWRGSLH
ncbi:FXYD domain-containing ion transport regulator 3 isoform X3 [Sturnira hondurensis]|nr:FXYD domain-containing ion transport regulator 3 isoform X2 [Sturnira hondurensis]XP_036895514.1 FXYD domain-containing ion transport regulator 3 isoform X3 [Sturnira hondurensis]